jgi:hypothetical protein
MWNNILKHLAKYPSAVFTALDAAGYPYSVRITPQPDHTRQVLRLPLPDYVSIQTGPASILCHYHDDQLWNQTNFVLRGTVAQVDGAWEFKATQFIEGAGAGMSMLRQIRDGRRAASQYLAKRGIARPRIPWDQIKALYDRAQKG